MEQLATIDSILQCISAFPDQTQLALAVIRNGRVDYHGIRKDKNELRNINNASSAFEIGSVTKAFTGFILAQLATEKKVNLNDLAQRYLPFPLWNSPPVTLKHLAMHTSGLPGLPHDLEDLPGYDKDNPYKNYSEELLATYLTRDLRLESLPGEKFLYSNLGAGLLGYIISRVEGAPFAKVVNERIFQPLKMQHSTFDIVEAKTEIVKGINDKGDFCMHWDGGILNGSLGIISTVEDLSRFAIMICDPSNAAANMQAKEIFVLDENVSINLGWSQRLILPENILMQGINGGTGGYGASILINRDKNCAVIILSNIWPSHYMDTIYPLGKALLVELSESIEV